MPGFNGTGPWGQGPLTGGGRGYCAIAFPPPATGRLPYGYVGLQGTPVRFGPIVPLRWPVPWRWWAFPAGWWGWPYGGRRRRWPRFGWWW
ncbi:MAG: DUF5320 domain-containing protein [Chloroflexi bacterium]|nr:DUF5320 domain-containing protein [Chloroflexota bacterium]